MNLVLKRSCSSILSAALPKDVNLVGRDYINPKNLTTTELKSVLWTAMDLQQLAKHRNLNNTSVQNARISLVLDKPCIASQCAIKNASNLLHAEVTTIIDTDWKKDYFHPEDFGRTLAVNSDIIFCKIQEHNIIEAIANGANIPVISISSDSYNLTKTLSDLMTMYGYFNYLKNLTVAWVGQPNHTINAYFCTFPQLKINLKYCFFDSHFHKGPLLIKNARKLSQKYNTEIHECHTVEDAVFRSDVIVTMGHNVMKYGVKMNHVKEAALKWGLLHDLPRRSQEIDAEVFAHKNSLVWISVENMQWIYAALLIRFLSGYNHVIQEPNFDGEDRKSVV